MKRRPVAAPPPDALPPESPPVDRPPSRSSRKRHATAAQELGVQLLELPEKALTGFPLEPELREALQEARGMRPDSGRRRQLQHIGALMRGADTDRIQELLEEWHSGGRQSAAAERRVTAWRDALVNGDDAAVQTVLAALPGLDAARFQELVQEAQAEKAAARPPHHSRELYRFLRAALQQQGNTPRTP